jgi:hypothetical protein
VYDGTTRQVPLTVRAGYLEKLPKDWSETADLQQSYVTLDLPDNGRMFTLILAAAYKTAAALISAAGAVKATHQTATNTAQHVANADVRVGTVSTRLLASATDQGRRRMLMARGNHKHPASPPANVRPPSPTALWTHDRPSGPVCRRTTSSPEPGTASSRGGYGLAARASCVVEIAESNG